MDYGLIALVAYGNASLQGRPASFPPDRLLSRDAKFDFTVPTPDTENGTRSIAATPDEWFAFLARSQVRGLRLRHYTHANDWKNVWKLDGLNYAIETWLPGNVSEFWVPYTVSDALSEPPLEPKGRTEPQPHKSWIRNRIELLTGPGEPAGRTWWEWLIDQILLVVLLPVNLALLLWQILNMPFATRTRSPLYPDPVSTWRHTLHLQGAAETEHPAAIDLAAATAELIARFQEIHAFAVRYGAEAWFVERFTNALDVLRGGAEPAQAAFLLPDKVAPHQATVLLSACAAGWVFGGMMSWNDVPYVDPSDPGEAERASHEYSRVSAGLFDAMMRAVVAATNSSCPRPLA